MVAGGLLLATGVIIGLAIGSLSAATASPAASTPSVQAAGAKAGTTATLTIRVRTTSGKLVKTLKGTTSADNVVLSWNFGCALPKGQYRVNAQVSGITCTP